MSTKWSLYPAIPLAFVAPLACGSAGAIDAPEAGRGSTAQAGATGWIVSVGGMAQFGPTSIGSRRYGLSGMPSIDFRRPGEPIAFSAPDDGFGISLIDTPRFKFGPVASLRSGRSNSDLPVHGLDTYPWTLEAGAFAEFWPVPDRFRTRIELRRGIHAHDGLVADISADLVGKIGRFTLSGGPRLALADAAVTQIEFGISPLAALRTGGLVATYQPRGGVQSVGYEVAATYDWSDRWRTTVFQRYDRLVDDPAASPLVRRFGSPDQFTFGVGLTYAFRTDLGF